MQFLSYLVRGISLGSVYALIALGYTMVYGIAKMLNFAHGDIIMVGGYVVFFTFCQGGMNPWLSMILAIVVCTLLGITIERIAYRPLRGAASLAVLITAIGVSYFLENGAMLLWSSEPKSFTSIVSLPALNLFGGSLQISAETIVTIVTSLVIMFVLIWFGLAAIAGALLLSSYPTLVPTTGAMPGIKAFVAAVFGGIGSIPGAFVGGILLGIIENLSKAYISTQLSDAIVFLVLIVVLLVKPSGLLGKKATVKV